VAKDRSVARVRVFASESRECDISDRYDERLVGAYLAQRGFDKPLRWLRMALWKTGDERLNIVSGA
jgi:hypothetical protein